MASRALGQFAAHERTLAGLDVGLIGFTYVSHFKKESKNVLIYDRPFLSHRVIFCNVKGIYRQNL